MTQITASRISTVLLVVLLLVFAALLFRSAQPAQAQNKIIVVVQGAPPGEVTEVLPGSQVVGFSCVTVNGTPMCYVASSRSVGK